MPTYLVVKDYAPLGTVFAADAGTAEEIAHGLWPGASILPPRAARAWLKLYHRRAKLLQSGARANELRQRPGTSHE
jgi:hypothetical protein